MARTVFILEHVVNDYVESSLTSGDDQLVRRFLSEVLPKRWNSLMHGVKMREEARLSKDGTAEREWDERGTNCRVTLKREVRA